jgi:hypothetical protein
MKRRKKSRRRGRCVNQMLLNLKVERYMQLLYADSSQQDGEKRE